MMKTCHTPAIRTPITKINILVIFYTPITTKNIPAPSEIKKLLIIKFTLGTFFETVPKTHMIRPHTFK